MQHKCPTCKVEFKSKHSIRKYCSRECYLDRNKHLTNKECLQCHETFKTYPNWIKRGGGKFCSRKCASQFHRNRVERECEKCGSKFSVKPSTLIYNASRFCSSKCSQVASRGVEKPSIQGENAPNWRGGVSFYPYGSNPYPSEFSDSLKEKIRSRDNYECQLCGMNEEEHILVWGSMLQVHHIDYVKTNCEEGNLVSLCNQCHGRTNYNREYWIDLFNVSLNRR